MIDLKTLKEIEWDEDGFSHFICESKELRQNAIKWIKALQVSRGLELSEFKAHGSDSTTNSNLIRWIKMFFNITDEDLK